MTGNKGDHVLCTTVYYQNILPILSPEGWGVGGANLKCSWRLSNSVTIKLMIWPTCTIAAQAYYPTQSKTKIFTKTTTMTKLHITQNPDKIFEWFKNTKSSIFWGQ